MKRILALSLCVLPLLSIADPAGSAKLTKLLMDMDVTRNGWCDVKDKAPDGVVERRSPGGKRAYDIFTETGHYMLIEVPGRRGVDRYYFSGQFVPDGPRKIKFDALEHKDPTQWEKQMGSKSILALVYAPDMIPTPGGCVWSSKTR